jgi:hypothetical protein
VTTTLNAIASGSRHPSARSHSCRPSTTRATPINRFQPTWKLGIAAYWFTSDGGCKVRYAVDCSATVSISPMSRSRGGVTGYTAKMTTPTTPEISKALRYSANRSGDRTNSQTRTATMNGQCPQM